MTLLFREDLQYWLRYYSEDTKGPEVIAEHARVTETIQSVKDQQYDLLNKLQREGMVVERQLEEGTCTCNNVDICHLFDQFS